MIGAVADARLSDVVWLLAATASFLGIASMVVRPVWNQSKKIDATVHATQRCEGALYPPGEMPLVDQVREIGKAVEALHADFQGLSKALKDHMDNEEKASASTNNRLSRIERAVCPTPVQPTRKPRSSRAAGSTETRKR